jgi:hypothetical protein
MRCFYDADEQIERWGKYLPEEPSTIYGERAATVVVFVSAVPRRPWRRRGAGTAPRGAADLLALA